VRGRASDAALPSAGMVFSSVTFLFFFLPAVLIAYYLVPRRARNALLVLASLLFYTWGAGWIVLVLLVSIGFNGLFGLGVERSMEAERRGRAQLILAVAVIANVAVLAWFKYANFTVETMNGIIGAAGGGALAWTDILLPIGISFYTFHSLSYLLDIYRGTARHLSSPIDFALYITFFPQLVAGPIVRFHEIREQLVRRVESVPTFAGGIYRFCHGLGKKVLIADTVAPIADAAFAVSPGELTTAAAVLGVIAYAVQLYFDFSGYSDMALGLAMMFGIHLPENFARPYSSRSVTEFWRRWHMSLSRWFRDYLYIPLGGNRGSALSTYRNLVIVFLIVGLWHGAAWTFVLWGAYHGVLLLVERALGVGRDGARRGDVGRGDAEADRPDPLGQARTVALVLFGWILFRAPDLGHAVGYMAALARPGLDLPVSLARSLDPLAIIALAIGCASVLLPRDWVTGVRLERATMPAVRALRLAVVALVFPTAVSFLIAGDFSPFLYFQF
jgi:alginate O-acetyltransferase complex protein AlgI